MVGRALAGLAFLGLLLAAGPGDPMVGSAQAQGCTPCQCGAAYCEGNRTYWPAVFLEDPGPVAAGVPFEVAWRLRLVAADGGEPAGDVQWGVRGLGQVLSWTPVDEAGEPSGPPVDRVAANDTLFAADHTVDLTVDLPGRYVLRIGNDAHRWSDLSAERVVLVGQGVAQAAPTDDASTPTPSRPTAGPAGAALLAAALAALVVQRRFS